LGFDAVARQLFYDHLIADYAECPRTILLSSHLIDEVADLIENVIVIDHGRIIMDEPTEAVRGRAVNIVGDADAIQRLVAGREVIHRESLGRVASVTMLGRLSEVDRDYIAEANLDLTPVSLQQLVVRSTRDETAEHTDSDTNVRSLQP
ncbi:MAG: ABC transporter ATP-binding protein, partial [Brevibacterium sp.]